MKSTSKMWMVIIVLLSITMSYAQIKNAKTETVKIYGNCEMCKATIEKAGNIKKTAKVDWNETTKMASITYDSKLTNRNSILNRIALSGYDSDSFLAPDLAYSKLMDCCKYERISKILPIKNVDLAETAKANMPKTDEHASHTMPMETKDEPSKIQVVYNSYFELKDALVATNGTMASVKAIELEKAINYVKMNELEMNVHMVWMKVVNDLKLNAEHIATTKETDHQREHFIGLSKSMYELMKVAKTENPVYYQYCPMANNNKGANWLSKESDIKNPYFGSEMMTCGKTVETIKL